MNCSLRRILFAAVLCLQGAAAPGATAQSTPQSTSTYAAPLYTSAWSAPSRYPDRIALTFSGDPTSSISVTWRTDTTVTVAYAEIAEATAAPRFWRTATRHRATTTTMDARAVPNAQVISNHHSVTFTGLNPATRYAYRVGDGTVWSEWNHYTTAADTRAPFSFLYVGDAQNNILELWSRLLREGYRRVPDARFIVHAGDLVNRAHMDSEWHEWFEAGGWIHRVVPSVPVPGNHEYDEYRPGEEDEHLSVQWPYHFTLPEHGPPGLEETAYVVDYQGARIIGLNSNLEHEKQAAWVDGVLAASPHPWSIIAFHHPIYSASEGRDNERLRSIWKPVFDRHHVDLVLQGHDHTYARGMARPAVAENVPAGVNVRDRSGTVYVVSVSGGKMYTLKPNGWDGYDGVGRARAGENTQLFQQITVSGDTLRFASYTATQELYDSFLLIRQADGLNRLVELCAPCTPERTHDNTVPYDDPVTDPTSGGSSSQ